MGSPAPNRWRICSRPSAETRYTFTWPEQMKYSEWLGSPSTKSTCFLRQRAMTTAGARAASSAGSSCAKKGIRWRISTDRWVPPVVSKAIPPLKPRARRAALGTRGPACLHRRAVPRAAPGRRPEACPGHGLLVGQLSSGPRTDVPGWRRRSPVSSARPPCHAERGPVVRTPCRRVVWPPGDGRTPRPVRSARRVGLSRLLAGCGRVLLDGDAPAELGRPLEHGGHRAVLLLGKADGFLQAAALFL